MEEVEKALKKYKAVTIEIIHAVKRGDYEKIQPLFSNREELLQSLKGMNFDSEYFKKILSQERIIEADDELRKAINDRKKQVVMQINSSTSANRAALDYNKNKKNIDINIFNEMI